MDPSQIEESREASMAFWNMVPRTFNGTQGAATLAEWLHNMEAIFRLCHIVVHLQVMLTSRHLIREARIWWLSLGDLEIPRDVWMNFLALIILRYRPLPGEGLNMHHRDVDIYRDMYMRRYVSYVVAWRLYPKESIGHYCQRFRDAMLPYIPLDMNRPMMQALHILKDGLPPEVRQFTPPPTIEMALDEMIDAITGAEIITYMVQVAPEFQAPEYEDAALPIQGIPP
ncbi:hypothetical protein TIFTF001_015362 [Ficus carica]|uniref:Uncharacterized protein n=1 Tax=Ficus carica TaxID=3494 RepID=A0AA88A126_FICCA|nr:hypothetical protein TIFTF001_015362 [Ficus carica]